MRPIATSLSRNDRWLLIGDRSDARCASFAAALRRHSARALEVVGYDELPDALARFGDGAGWQVRIDSPGRRHEVACAFVGREVPLDQGRILFGSAWYRGFVRRLRVVRERLPEARFASDPDDIALAFDKPRCQALLAEHGVPVPHLLGDVESYDDLVTRMNRARRNRVFVKLAHGSAASGVVAYRRSGARHEAVTTVELSQRKTYNSRRLRRLTDERAIAELIDALAVQRLYAEAWIPKRAIGGRASDLRVLVVGGEPAHAVLRMARGPITNLHLGAERAVSQCDDALAAVARRAAACFGRSLHVALDLAVTTSGNAYVLEVNAFGDHLKGVLHHGRTTHEWELDTWYARC